MSAETRESAIKQKFSAVDAVRREEEWANQPRARVSSEKTTE